MHAGHKNAPQKLLPFDNARRDDMIKPHGSDTLNPLYVADDAAREQLMQEAH